MCSAIRPVQVIADGEDNITGRPVGADDVNSNKNDNCRKIPFCKR